MISENQGLEKLRSVLNLRKISGTAHLDFFSICHLDIFQIYCINLALFLCGDLEKKSRFAGPEIFLRFEADLDFQESRCRLKGRNTTSEVVFRYKQDIIFWIHLNCCKIFPLLYHCIKSCLIKSVQFKQGQLYLLISKNYCATTLQNKW